ncbi:MAG: MATE family efflux transporter [Sphaerospermopsis sp. SIO1G2]|nr:MATE family efflux transporter [Sphaerospermopsis sp. SIO1G2]
MTFVLPSSYNFLPRFYRLASVSMLSNMMIPLAGLVDTAFLGHLADIRHLAGVILGTILFDYLYRVLKFLRSSTNTITAQATGLDQPKEVVLVGLRSGLIGLSLGLLIILLQYPIQKFGFFVLSGSPDIEISGMNYFNGRIWGAPAVLLNFVFFGWFLGREMNGVVLLMSIITNGANVVLDYFMIVKWGWESMGAGLATAFSQYLGLIVGLVAAIFTIQGKVFLDAISELFDWVAIKNNVILKSNILIRFLILISVYSIFTNLSAGMGKIVLSENGLLLQIALFSQFTVQGVGVTTQTLTGNFKSKGNQSQMLPLLITSIISALAIALSFVFVSVVFPEQVFGLLTNHEEISSHITDYTIWLLPVLIITALAFMLEGYFIGLKEGVILRNAVLIAFFIGFVPLAIAAWYFQSNHLLWGTLVSYMATLMIVLAVQVPGTLHQSNNIKDSIVRS